MVGGPVSHTLSTRISCFSAVSRLLAFDVRVERSFVLGWKTLETRPYSLSESPKDLHTSCMRVSCLFHKSVDVLAVSSLSSRIFWIPSSSSASKNLSLLRSSSYTSLLATQGYSLTVGGELLLRGPRHAYSLLCRRVSRRISSVSN